MYQNVHLLGILILRITLTGYRQQFQKLEPQTTEKTHTLK